MRVFPPVPPRPRAPSPASPPSPRYLDVLDAVVAEAVEAQRAVGEAVSAVGQPVEQTGHGGVFASGVEPQGAVGLREQPRVVLPASLRGPGGLLVLVQGAESRVGVPQVRVSGLLALRVGQRRLRVRRGEVGRLEIGGGRVAERRGRAVGRLVESGQLRQAGPGRRPGQPLGAVLRRRETGEPVRRGADPRPPLPTTTTTTNQPPPPTGAPPAPPNRPGPAPPAPRPALTMPG